MSRANAAVTFWICPRCATPNPRAGYLTHCIACGAVRPQDGPAAKPARPSGRRADVRPRWRGHVQRGTLLASWAYALAMAGLVGIIAVAGDRWWPTTVALFGPRWIAAIPLGLLIPAALLVRRWVILPPILLGTMLVLGPWMGLCLPLGAARGGGPLRLRILTCNLEGPHARGLPALIAAEAPDVVILEECPTSWTARLLPGPGWFMHRKGELLMASRLPIREFADHDPPGLRWGWSGIGRIVIETPVGAVDVYGVHLQTPRKGLNSMIRWKLGGVGELRENTEQRRREAEAASRWVAGSDHPHIVAGDFNLTVESTIYRDAWSSYLNAFSAAGLGFGPTKYTRWLGVRIDHILGGPGWGARACWVGPDIGSDHRPVIADLEWNPPRD